MIVATSDMQNSEREEKTALLKNAVLIAGPTASGKSGLAAATAEAIGGVVVNADSMQVYGVLDVLTARPGAAELARAPHHLYGHVSPERNYSTGAWLRDVAGLAAKIGSERRFVFVGGTGLYFRALAGGLSEMPTIPQATREHWRARLAAEGPERLHAELARRDGEAAARLGPADGQRIVRALEVIDHTARPIGEWQSRRGRPLIDVASAACLVIEPERAELHRRIEARLDAMIEAGALEEVRALLALGLEPSLPAMKAIGVRELDAVMSRKASIADAVEKAKAATRQYAKRQSTWFRHQLGPEWQKIPLDWQVEKIGLPVRD